jgi:hypothetical protein
MRFDNRAPQVRALKCRQFGPGVRIERIHLRLLAPISCPL